MHELEYMNTGESWYTCIASNCHESSVTVTEIELINLSRTELT